MRADEDDAKGQYFVDVNKFSHQCWSLKYKPPSRLTSNLLLSPSRTSSRRRHICSIISGLCLLAEDKATSLPVINCNHMCATYSTCVLFNKTAYGLMNAVNQSVRVQRHKFTAAPTVMQRHQMAPSTRHARRAL